MATVTPDLRIDGLRAAYRRGALTPEELIRQLHTRAGHYAVHNIWTYRLSNEELKPYLNRLATLDPAATPLWGVPFAIKDNIDLAGVPTTAACPAFGYMPDKHAFVVEQLIQAGAIPLGKTNLDQFATGLVGTRSPDPWGPCRNAFDPDYISGGSSSGSAVAVALGLASFSLGTDTAGSGRVPAALNNLVGLKPTRGLLGTTGVVPACRSLDCVSVFGLTAEDTQTVFAATAAFDERDAYARHNPFDNGPRRAGIASGPVRVGIPAAGQLEFFGDAECERLWRKAVDDWRALGAETLEIDFAPFLAAARLLYEGPWVAERYLAVEALLKRDPEAVHPVVRGIIENGAYPSAAETFRAFHRLQAYKRKADREMAKVDLLLTPTVGTRYRVDEVLGDPVTLNSNLGYYANYMNLLDYSAVAVPAGFSADGMPWGVTLVAGAFEDQKLLARAAAWQRATAGRVGALDLPPYDDEQPRYRATDTVDVAVCGAHLDGQPLNWQLVERGGVRVERTRTAPCYRLYALPDGKRPALVRDEGAGSDVEIEIWRLPATAFGGFVAAIPPPLGIGKVEAADGRFYTGFICEQGGLEGATEITEYGGWLGFLENKNH